MGLFSSLAKSMATKIGLVIGGDYKGAQVGFGTKSTNTKVKVSVSTKNNASMGNVSQDEALIFFTKPEEYRFDGTDVESYTVKSSDNATTTYEIIFKDGKKSLVQISNQYKHKIDSALYV
ncbi:MAG: hypothetical protein LUI60_00025 [Clostridia bacterium]|nr:hypothetical protein [Clostridia bacterium]